MSIPELGPMGASILDTTNPYTFSSWPAQPDSWVTFHVSRMPIGLFPKGGCRDIAVVVRIRRYNEAVPRLNAMLWSGQVKEFLLPEERPDLTKRLGLL